MSYKLPNHTQTPNELFDIHMRLMDMAELKVVLTICRKTFGWHKEKDRISLSQLEELTGMSRTSVIKGIQDGIGREIIERFACDDGFEYGLIVDASTENVPPVPLASTESVHTKESVLKKNTATRDRFTDMLKQNPNPLTEYPPGVQDLLQAFADEFGRYPRKDEKSGWIKAANQWRSMGVTPAHVGAMCKHSRSQSLAITSPFSITYAFDAIRNLPKPEVPVKVY